jgi:hypothetical protein
MARSVPLSRSTSSAPRGWTSSSPDIIKSSKWPDFLFTITVRFVCGINLGCLACFLFAWKGILRSFSCDNARGPLILMILFGLVDGIIAVFTVPHWQRPWYKGIRGRDDDV